MSRFSPRMHELSARCAVQDARCGLAERWQRDEAWCAALVFLLAWAFDVDPMDKGA